MKTLIKILLAVVAVIVIAVLAIALFFDPNDYKPQIQQLARDKASIELNIQGDMGWSLFPTLGLELPKVDAASLDGAPLASIRSAQLAVSIPALLGGEVKMSGVTVDGLNLSIKSSGEKESKASKEADHKDAGPGVKLDIGDVVLKDANIRYENPSNGQTLILNNFNFKGENVNSSSPFPTSMSFQLQMQEQGQMTLSLNADMKTQLALNTLQQVYELIGLELTLDIQHAALGDKPQTLKLSGNILADLTADKAALSKFSISLANLNVNTDLDISQMSKAPSFKGHLNIDPFDAKALLKSLGQAVPQTQQAEALKSVALRTQIGGPANVIQLNDLQLTLDKTTFKGQLSHNLGSGAQRIQLSGDDLVLDHYLPPASETAKQETSSGERYPKTPLLPIDVLQGLNLDADFTLSKLTASGVNISDLKLLLNAHNGLIQVPTISGNLYQGSFDNSATIDARKTPLTMEINKSVSQVQLGSLLKDLTQQDKLSGVFDMKGQYQTTGNSVYDIVHSLDGNMNLNLKDGRIKGVNLVDKLCSGIMTLKGQQPDENAAVNYTEFSNMSASMTMNDGLVSNQDLKAALVGVNLTGAGQVNLPQEALDYALSLTVLQELKGPNCQLDKKLHNLSLPLRCKGSFDTAPTQLCGLDKEAMSKVLADLGAAEVKAKAEAKVEETKDKVETQIKDKLKGLFGR